VEVQRADIGGDIFALALYTLRARTLLDTDRIIIGLRSLGRGTAFSAYINLADEQNVAGITVTAAGSCAFGNSLSAATGREVAYTAGGNGTVSLQLDAAIGNHYYGIYHAYLRGTQDGGYAGDTTMDVLLELGSGDVIQTHITGLQFEPDVDWYLVDLGRLEIAPPSFLDSDEGYDEHTITITVAGTQDVHLYDLVLIPVDEWAAEFVDPEQGVSTNDRLELWRVLEIDSVRHPKQTLRAILYNQLNQRIVGQWDKRANGPAMLQANAGQRVWFLTALGDVSRPEVAFACQIEAVQRYLSMRGDR
jgi:hypothetical protein